MARSPLMDAVLRCLRAHRASRATGIPAEEWLLSRRDALRAAAGAAAGAALAGCALPGAAEADPPPNPSGGPRVVIVGAGIAGLHCARRLAGLGVAAEVREASGRSGGRMFSDHHTFGPQSCELGGELVDTGHGTMQDLAQELGLELLDFTTDDAALAPWIAHVGGRRLTEREILDALAPVAARVEADLAPERRVPVDRMSIREWLDGTGLSGEVRRFVDVAYTTEYGLEPEESSALNFVSMISTDMAKLAIFGESDERFRFRAGNEIVPERIARDLGPGTIRLASRLVRVRRIPDGRLRLTFDRGAVLGSEEVLCDHAVLAIPFTLLRDVEIDLEMAPLKRRAIRELGYGTNAKIMAGFRERTWRARGSNGEVFSDLPFQCSWETSRLQDGAAGILTNFTGGKHGMEIGSGPASVRAQEFVDGIDRVFPGAADAYDRRAVRMHWPSHAWTRGSYASYRVGQISLFGGREIERVGNLHFCGEHTSLDAQGFMEGGALTGAMAAVEVAEDLGISIPAGNPILDRARAARVAGGRLPPALGAVAAHRRRSPVR